MQQNTIILAAGPNGLGVARSLYLEGVRCQAIARDKNDIIHKSKVPTKTAYIEGATIDEQHQWLLNALKNEPVGTVIIPTSDWFVTFLTEHTERLKENCVFIIPNAEISEVLIDKAKETSVVGKVIPVPKTIQEITTEQQVIDELELPIIIKPRSHKHMVLGCKNIIINTIEELSQFFVEFGDKVDNLIAQEIIKGKDDRQWVCNCFFDEDSNITQAFTFNRLRLSPSHYGVTSYAISKHNQDVIDLSAKLGKALNYVGPAMVEFKQDEIDGIYKYIEINPRLGMCNYFDTSCGVNNSLSTYRLATKQSLPQGNKMREDIMFMSFYEDLFSRLRDGESFMSIIKEYIVNFTKKRHVFIYFCWWDIKPALSLFSKQVKGFISSRLSKLFK